jgi:hypothetical protein
MPQTRRGKRTDPDVEQAIAQLATEGTSAPRIEALLSQDKRYADRLPRIRAIQGIAARYRLADPSGEWRIVTAPLDDVAYVLPVLAELAESDYPTQRPTLREGHYIAMLRRYDPTIPAVTAYLIARVLVVAEDDGRSTREIEEFLGFRAWRDGGDRYLRALEEHRIDGVQFWHGFEWTALARLSEGSEGER